MKKGTLSETGKAERLTLAIRSLVERFSVARRADAQCCGTTVAQAAALVELAAAGPLRLGELAGRLGVENSTMTRNLSRLAAAGLVLRSLDPRDGRVQNIQLTESGRRAARFVLERELAFARSVLDQMGADSGRVLDSLEALVAAVDRASRFCCPEVSGATLHETSSLQEAAREREE